MAHPFSKKPLGVIFDCDGVIINSRDANISYYNAIMKMLGRPPLTEDQARYAQMSTARQAFEYVLDEPELARLPELFARLPYAETVTPTLPAMPGFEAFANWLRSEGVPLALHTNRTEGIWDVLDRFGWRPLFDIVKNVRNALPKPDPDGVHQIMWEWGVQPEDLVFIGDSDTDLGAAHGAGVPFIAFGNPGMTEAEWHVSSYDELQRIWEPLFVSETHQADRVSGA